MQGLDSQTQELGCAAKKLGTKIPTTWALTKDGEVTDDPNKAVLLQPFGGYKGYAISVVVEALTGALAGSAFSKDTGSIFSMEKGQNLGHFFMVFIVPSELAQVQSRIYHLHSIRMCTPNFMASWAEQHSS